mgnify:CR=1 FL=1
MDGNSESGRAISTLVPDKLVPSERVTTKADHSRQKRRDERFLKGPVRFTWIRKNIPCPASRLLLILRAYTDMQTSTQIKVGTAVLKDAGISNRQAAYRAIRKLESAGSLAVHRKPGCKPTVALRD